MNAETENQGGMMDTIKLSLAVLTVTAAVLFFYLQPDQSQLVRVLAVVGAVIVAALLGLGTARGREFSGFFKETQNEVRRVVWPTQQESVQTTLIVIVTVIIAAVILWLFDSFLGWAVRWLTGMGGS